MSIKTPNWLEEPVFSLTSDVDWASEYCISEFLHTVTDFGVVPTVFATHKSDVLNHFHGREEIELGVHPNFLPGSSHGSDVCSVVTHMFELVPNAVCFRSHHFVDSTGITSAMTKKGVKFDSNLCLYLQPNLIPLHHASGILRFPVFWEDDLHWHRRGSWCFEEYQHFFVTPGLKVLNVHPFMFTLNISDGNFYVKAKSHIPSLTEEEATRMRNRSDGVRTFVTRLLESLINSGHRFFTLGEIYDSYRSQAAHDS